MSEQPIWKAWRKGEGLLAGIDGLLHGTRGDASPRSLLPRGRDAPDAQAQLSIRDYMTRDPIRVRFDTPLQGALWLLIKEDLSALPVVDETGAIVGLLNERHVLLAVGNPEGTTIPTIMDTDPVTIEIDEPIVEIVDRLMAINVRQVLVLEDSTLVGVVTRADLMPAILEMLRTRAQAAHSDSPPAHS